MAPSGLEPAREIHALDFGELEATDESFESNTLFEYYGNPRAGEVGTTTPSARGSQLDRIGLILGRRLHSRSVINPPCRPFPGADGPRLVACHSAWLTSAVISWRREGFDGLLGIKSGNMEIPSRTSAGAGSQLSETNQGSLKLYADLKGVV